MKEKLEQIKAEAVAKIQEADVPEKLNDVRVKTVSYTHLTLPTIA